VDQPAYDLIRGPRGEALSLKVYALIDDPATQDVRVVAAVDDGVKGALGWVKPGSAAFIKRPDNSLVDE
jgi:hypothetical protein